MKDTMLPQMLKLHDYIIGLTSGITWKEHVRDNIVYILNKKNFISVQMSKKCLRIGLTIEKEFFEDSFDIIKDLRKKTGGKKGSLVIGKSRIIISNEEVFNQSLDIIKQAFKKLF